MKITNDVYEQIKNTVGRFPAETGGLLAGPLGLDAPITHYFYDAKGACGRAAYSPDTETVNKMLREWPDDIRLRGFVHSHPSGYTRLSGADIEYAARILACNKTLPNICLPIVQSAHDTGGAFSMHGYMVKMVKGRPRVLKTAIQIEGGEAAGANLPSSLTNRMFDRVHNAYDIARLANSLVIVAGVGGAASFVDMLARTGIGNFVLIDPDTVSETNLATQQYYRSDVGRPKVEALAERVQRVNADTNVYCYHKKLEHLNEEEWQEFMQAQSYASILLVAMTDSFIAQSTANRIALDMKIPLLAGQMYSQGCAAELVFTVPGVTPACMRCVLSSRYAQHMEGYINDVSSVGSPISSCESLNSSAGSLAMAILHHGTNHPRWGGLIERMGNRNLVQLRLHPDVGHHLGLKIFDRVFGEHSPELFYGETVWRPVMPDNPANGFPTCPDCGGTGDLRNPLRWADQINIQAQGE